MTMLATPVMLSHTALVRACEVIVHTANMLWIQGRSHQCHDHDWNQYQCFSEVYIPSVKKELLLSISLMKVKGRTTCQINHAIFLAGS